jgi:hypothetical protein
LAQDPDNVTTTRLMRRSTFVSEFVWMHVFKLQSQTPPGTSSGPVICTIGCNAAVVFPCTIHFTLPHDGLAAFGFRLRHNVVLLVGVVRPTCGRHGWGSNSVVEWPTAHTRALEPNNYISVSTIQLENDQAMQALLM